MADSLGLGWETSEVRFILTPCLLAGVGSASSFRTRSATLGFEMLILIAKKHSASASQSLCLTAAELHLPRGSVPARMPG